MFPFFLTEKNHSRTEFQGQRYDSSTSLAKKVMFLVACVCLFICLPVSNITQNVINSLQLNFMEGSRVVKKKKWLHFGGDMALLRWLNKEEIP